MGCLGKGVPADGLSDSDRAAKMIQVRMGVWEYEVGLVNMFRCMYCSECIHSYTCSTECFNRK